MESVRILVPRELVKEFHDHPEPPGKSLVTLINGMHTDVYTSDDGYLFTLTNDYKLIDYLCDYIRSNN